MKHLALALLLSGATLAQEFPAISMHAGSTEVTATYGPPRPEPVVTGASYSADQIQEYKGHDRNPTRNVIGRFARDTQGRTRKEIAYNAAPYWLTTIYDPLAGVAYLLDDTAKIAHRMALPPYDTATARPPIAGPNDESLGTQVVNGQADRPPRERPRAHQSPRKPHPHRARPVALPAADYRVVDQAAPFLMTTRLK